MKQAQQRWFGLTCCFVLQEKRQEARAVLLRILQIGAAVGVAVGLAAFASRSLVPAIFSRDVRVSAEVQKVVPMIALFMVSPAGVRSRKMPRHEQPLSFIWCFSVHTLP